MISTFGRRKLKLFARFHKSNRLIRYSSSSTEAFLLIVCGSIPTLKPLYDSVHQHAKSVFSSISTPTSSNPYGSDKSQRRSQRMNLDPRFSGRPYRIGSHEQSFGISAKADAGPVARDDGWNQDDGHALLEMGDINVERGWEVTREARERQGSGPVPIHHALVKPAHSGSTIITADSAV